MAVRNYYSEAEKLSSAIDCALTAFQKHPPADWSSEQMVHFTAFYSNIKHAVLQPPPQYQNLASLRYQEQDVFTYFQEASGKEVEYFWEQVQQLKLGYKRIDLLQKILKRNKIKNRIEYEYSVDILVVSQQTSKITSADAQKLSALIDKFESASGS